LSSGSGSNSRMSSSMPFWMYTMLREGQQWPCEEMLSRGRRTQHRSQTSRTSCR
jgi:hypothetical protein